ncbi:sensor histidine kinase [Desulfitibacter alkalitolerans]|uniref:sensor histidine kinase n=1 Tax=Desulfitibacter alkalitolerans TaxID=264641 RepID=UPI0004821923|nr:ATP-binding protein [Desulfitibacter alkalitolerans]
MKFGVNHKLRILLILIVLLVLLFVSIFLDSSIRKYYFNREVDSLLEKGQSLALKLGHSESLSDYKEEIRFLSEFIGADIIIINRDKKIVVCSEGHHLDNGMYMDWEELKEIFQGKSFIHHGEYFGFRDSRISIAVPIYQDQHVMGTVLISKSVDTFTDMVDDMRKIILMVGLGAVLLTVLVTPIVSYRFTKPLSQIIEAAQKMLQGDFSGRVTIITKDEIGDLARCFNSLSKELERSVGELFREKDKLISVLESMDEGVLTFDKNRNLTLISPQTKNLLNVDTDSYSLADSPEGKLILAMVYKAVKRKMLEEREIEINNKVVSLRANLLKDSKTGEVMGAVVIIQDVSVKRKADQLRKEFLASVSHEIRTPLSIMQGYTEALLDGMADTPEDNNTYLLIIKDEIIRLRVLVDDLLDLNKMEAGNFALKKDYYDVERLLKRVKRKYSSFQDNTDISIELTIQPDIPLIYGDERRIEQALINLVENAIRHTPDGGRIIISAFCEDAKLTLQVTDNGEGIPYNELPYIWDRFFKVDKARTREKAGSGLGLAIVKNIIEAHGGTVGVRSVEGQGSMFKMEFPIN